MHNQRRWTGCTLGFWAAIVLGNWGVTSQAATPELPFYENFEPDLFHYQDEWHAFDAPANRYDDCPSDPNQPHLDYCPYDPSLLAGIPNPPPNDSWTWGPYKFETWPDKDTGGHVYSGQRSGRQPIWDPYWASLYHLFDSPADPTKDLRLKVQVYDPADILCDCDPYGPPSRPNFDVHGGMSLHTGTRDEYYSLVINTKQSWTNYMWATATDGWNVSSVPRTKAWHLMEIVVHPYTGNLGDVEFRIDGVTIAQGHRAVGGGNGIPVNYLRLGGDPAIVAESTLTNTLEEIWYDEVALTGCHNPRPDVDGDGDVDQEDFGVLQRCWTGPHDPFTYNLDFDGANCQCIDIDGEKDVDQDDYNIFEICASGPGVAADPDCDE